MNALEWNGRDKFIESQVEETYYGLFKRYGNLTFVKFFGAGHMVPMDQPNKSLDMLMDFLKRTNY